MIRSVNQLREYQGTAIEWMLSHPQAGLFLDMGLGKTASALTAVYEFNRFGVGPTLVVGPIRVIETVWRQEAAKWSHLQALTFSLVRGKPEQRKAALAAKADIYLINPEHLEWMFDTLGEGPYKFETLIIDESSMFKNVGSERFKKLRFKVKHFARRYILTGTPTPNRLLELWSQIYILDEGQRLGTSFTRYKERYFYPVDRWGYKWEPRAGAKEKIYEAIADLVLRIEAQFTLPIVYNPVNIDLPDQARKIYKEVEDQAFSKLTSDISITALNAIGALTKCRQIANGVVYGVSEENGKATIEPIHDEKIKATKEIIDETGSPVIVVYNYKHELAQLTQALKEYSPVVLTDAKDSEKVVDDWNAGKIQVLLLHPASGGHGLNLQEGGHTMIWFGLTFSYEQFAQTVARIHRQGQLFTVVVHLLLATGTVDEMMVGAIEAKRDGQGELLDFLKEYAKARGYSTLGV